MIVAPNHARVVVPPPAQPPGLTTSASQVTSFEKCNRFWYFASVQKIRTPPTASQQFGTNTHSELEKVLQLPGHTPSADFARIVAAARAARHDPRHGGYPVMPDPVTEIGTYRLEGAIWIPTYKGGPIWNGFVDLWVPNRAPPEVVDYKTTSDLRYAKTEAELSVDPQMVSYGKWALDQFAGLWKKVRVTHLYLTTRGKPKALPVTVDLDADHVETQWLRLLGRVRKMESLRAVQSADDITPTGVDTGHCHAYGGCQYRSQCGIDKLVTITSRPKTNAQANSGASMSDQPTNSLLARLQRVRQGLPATDEPAAAPPATAAPPPAEPPPAAPPASAVAGVVPVDAPSREQDPLPPEATAPAAAGAEPTLAQKIDAAPKRRPGRPKGSKNAAKEGPAVGPSGTALDAPPPTVIDKPIPAGKAATCPACGGYAPIDTKGRYMDHPGVDTDLKPYPEGMGVCVTSGDVVDEAHAAVKKIRARLAAPAPAEDVETTPAVVAIDTSPAVRAETSAARAAGVPVVELPAPPELEEPAADTVIEAIYIDCLPVKGAHKGAFVMMEDWLAPVLKVVAEANGVADYRLISYTSRGALAEGISAQRQLAPPRVLVVASQASGADVVLENLIPFARTVVRGMRG